MGKSTYLLLGGLLFGILSFQTYADSCPKCGTVFSNNHSWRGSDSGYKQDIRSNHIRNCRGGTGGGGGSLNTTYEQRLAGFRRINYVFRLMMLPVLGMWTPMLMLNAMVINEKAYNDYLGEIMLVFTEPLWIVPYGIGKGMYHYFAMDVFEETPQEYSAKVSKASSAAYARMQTRHTAPPVRPQTRKSDIDKRIAQLNRDAAHAARTSQLQRLMTGVRKTQKEMDRPSTRARLIGQAFAPISDEAMHSIRQKKTAVKDGMLMGAFNVGTAAFGLPGAAVKRVVSTTLDAGEIADDLVVMETSRMENQARRLKTLHRLLAETKTLPAKERPAEIKRILAEAKPLLDASAKNRVDSEWAMVGKAASRKENWLAEVPVLRKKILAFAAGKGLGKVTGMVHRRGNAVLRIRSWDKVLKERPTARFFKSGASAVTAEAVGQGVGKAAEPMVNGLDSLVDSSLQKEGE